MPFNYDKFKCLFPLTFWGISFAAYSIINTRSLSFTRRVAFTVLFANSIVGLLIVRQDAQSIANSCDTSTKLVRILDVPTHLIIPVCLWLVAKKSIRKASLKEAFHVWVWANVFSGTYMILAGVGLTTDYGLGLFLLLRKYCIVWVLASLWGSLNTVSFLL